MAAHPSKIHEMSSSDSEDDCIIDEISYPNTSCKESQCKDVNDDSSSASEEELISLAEKLQRKFGAIVPSTFSSPDTRDKPVSGSSVSSPGAALTVSDAKKFFAPYISKRTPDFSTGASLTNFGCAANGTSSQSQQSAYSVLSTTSENSQETQSMTSSQVSTTSEDSQGAKRKRRTPEEIAKAKEEALALRKKKEEEKRAVREQKEKEKQLKKQVRQKETEARRALTPGECLKYVITVMDNALLEGPGATDILNCLTELELNYRLQAQCVPWSVTWFRQTTDHTMNDNCEFDTISREELQDETLIAIPLAEFIDMVYNTVKDNAGCVTLLSHITDVRRLLPDCNCTFFVNNVDKYLRDQKNAERQNFRKAVQTAAGENVRQKKSKKLTNITTVVSRVEIEEALVELQLQANCNVHLLSSSYEVGQLIATFTKAVAEKPYKLERGQSAANFAFHAQSEAGGGVKVDKQGRGLARVWRQQIQQFRNVSAQVASAITAVYPSPQSLIQAYKRCTTEKEARMLLQDIVIRRGAGVLATSRRVGPELSKQIYTHFTSYDGNILTK